MFTYRIIQVIHYSHDFYDRQNDNIQDIQIVVEGSKTFYVYVNYMYTQLDFFFFEAEVRIYFKLKRLMGMIQVNSM